jgi:hypothetical protein
VQVKSLTGLWLVMAEELSAMHGVSTHRDSLTVTKRVNTEGLSFLTITLPTFCTDFERSLADGCIGSGQFLGFKRNGGLPAFLQGFLRRIFDAQSGTLLESPCVDSIIAIRQLTCLFKKLDLPCTDSRQRKALTRYLECEDELKHLDSEWTPDDFREFSRMSSMLFGNVFDRVNREVDTFNIWPKHGPGSTADRLLGNQKWRFTEWTERLERVFPYREYAGPNLRLSTVPSVHLAPGEERPVRVILVPKTQKTPRVIAIEPTCMQYLQQGLMRSLVTKLECRPGSMPSDLAADRRPLAFVGFSDQETNRLLARKGSSDGSLATLDLSEASDRVSNTLVREMLRPWPSLLEAVQATRSLSAELSDGTKVRLSKFASMGSALCFPMEAMVFTTIVFLGIQDARKTRLTPKKLRSFEGKVRVFGDDIIVPADCAIAVMEKLEAFGLKVNTNKSFWTGMFRESCGGDYYQGEWVTPLRLGTMPPYKRQDVAELLNWIEFSNSLHFQGYWKSALYVSNIVERVLGKLPVTQNSSAALSLKSFHSGFRGRLGWDKDLQVATLHAWTVSARSPINEIDGLPALRKALSGDWSDPIFREHLVRSGRPSSVRVKKRWVPA